jgi:signal transduction histidine kinase
MLSHIYFNNLSIRTKLSLVVLVVCTIVLFLISSVVLVVEIYSSRANLIHEMRILGGSLAQTVRLPLLLDKPHEAEQLLQSLTLQNNIHGAYLLDRHTEPVAEYLDFASSNFVMTALEHDFSEEVSESLLYLDSDLLIGDWSHLSLFLPIMHDGRQAGTLYMVSDLHALYRGIGGIFFGGILALLLLIAFSWLLASRLQRPITTPLLELADMMRVVAERRYSVRAISHSSDEVGQLVSGFNAMLEQIELHQLSLARHQQELEATVEERTSDLRAAIAELEVARKQADSANEAKSAFLSRMTHELRTPMIGVLGMNELLARTSLDERQTMLVETVQKSGEELLQLIKGVLDFSRIENGQLPLKTADVDLYELGEDVLRLLAPGAAAKGLSLESVVPLTALWKVRTDEQRIRQIVMNLVGNAIKFTESGRVKLSLRLEQIESEQGLFVFEVEDSGVGMDEASALKIYDLFYQIDGGDTRAQSGAGLGLAIVKQLVELMQGELEVRSQVGQGSCFTVRLRLPLVEQIEFSLPEELRCCSALICADHLDSGSVVQLKLRLEALGFRVDETASATTALDLLAAEQQTGQPHVFVCVAYDQWLPDGTRFYDRLTGQGRSPYQVVVLSDPLAELPPDVRRLDLPLTWKPLLNTLRDGWHELCLAEFRETASVADGGMPSGLLVLCGDVAKCELLRLVLTPYYSGRVRFAGNLLVAARSLTDFGPTCVLVDVSEFTAAQAAQLVAGHRDRPCLVGFAEQAVGAEDAAFYDRVFVRLAPREMVDYLVPRLTAQEECDGSGQV